jgi:class 3 adenylate cyclase
MIEPQADELRDVPEFRALLVVDMKGYSKAPSHLMPEMRADLDRMMAQAMAESGLAKEWAEHGYWSDRGDGFLLAMPVARLWRLVDPLPENLESILARRDRGRRAVDPQIRVRMSVHVGPLPPEYRGDPMNDACRLVDSDAAKSAVTHAERLDSYLALVISDAVFQTVVRSGRTLRLKQHDFLDVQAAVGDKFSERAWAHVPRRSPSELTGAAVAGRPQREQGAGEEPARYAVNANTVGNVFNGSTGPTIFDQRQSH